MAQGTGGSVLQALSNDLTAAVEHVGQSVVAIHARRRIPASGIVWGKGIVVAANHTIHRDEDISVTFADGRTLSATLRGRDPATDLAVLTISSGDAGTPSAPLAERGESAELRVGAVILALGRPDGSVTERLMKRSLIVFCIASTLCFVTLGSSFANTATRKSAMIERTFSSPYVDIAHLLVPVLWFGLLVGVCFVAVPVKFAAP